MLQLLDQSSGELEGDIEEDSASIEEEQPDESTPTYQTTTANISIPHTHLPEPIHEGQDEDGEDENGYETADEDSAQQREEDERVVSQKMILIARSQPMCSALLVLARALNVQLTMVALLNAGE